MIEPAEPVLPGIETTQFSAEQWKSRAMYEEACKLSMERALARAIDALNEALFAAAYAAQQPVEDLTIDRRAWPLDPGVWSQRTPSAPAADAAGASDNAAV